MARVQKRKRSGSVGESQRRMLVVLEASDPLGLLDRVFPANAQAASLRILLARPQEPPVLYAAILNLRPRPSSRHIRPSDTADQQRAFCALALSLLGPDISPPSPEPRYALLQHLPSGDYWSSLTSDRPSSPSGALKNINTGLADLAAILPTPLSHPSATLAAYSPNNLPSTKPLPLHRSLQPASFLDYGPSTSFAPTFDHDGELVGPRDLRLLLSYKKSRFLSHPPDSIAPPNDPLPLSPCPLPFDIHSELDGLLSPHVIQNLNLVLDTVHLQNLIDELLTRTHRALVRLQALQVNRLLQHPPQISLDESSEEWQTANGILESLQTLTSLRPRASSSSSFLSVIPPPSFLRNLHKTLALQPCPGWHGTLPENRLTALRDDSTVQVRAPSAGTAHAAPAPSTSSSPAPSSAAPLVAPAPSTTATYPGYPYMYNPQQAQAYRAATATATPSYTPYKTGATSYYQNYVQNAQSQYYGQQAYGTGVTNQQPYAAYSSWFAHQYAAAASGQGTPQPATSATAPTTTPYGYYLPSQQQQKPAAQGTATTSAVANTAAMSKSVSNGSTTSAWSGYTVGQQPTLPRTAVTPTTTNGVQQSK